MSTVSVAIGMSLIVNNPCFHIHIISHLSGKKIKENR